VVFDYHEVTALILATISEPPDLSRLPASVPPQLVEIVRRCLAKPPADRPASARALADELRALDFSHDPSWSPALARTFWQTHLPPRQRKPAEPGAQELESARTMLLEVSSVSPAAPAPVTQDLRAG
jgi:serine/threonine protein kinase